MAATLNELIREEAPANGEPVELQPELAEDLRDSLRAIDRRSQALQTEYRGLLPGPGVDTTGKMRRLMGIIDELNALAEAGQIARFHGGASLVASRSNVIMTRTFSKIHGMAGARVGYAIGTPELIQAFDKIRAGAGAVQLYSALVYGGLSLVQEIVEGLDALLASHGFANVAEAVGTGAGGGETSILPRFFSAVASRDTPMEKPVAGTGCADSGGCPVSTTTASAISSRICRAMCSSTRNSNMSRCVSSDRPKKVLASTSPSPRALLITVAPVAPASRAACMICSVFVSSTKATISLKCISFYL